MNLYNILQLYRVVVVDNINLKLYSFYLHMCVVDRFDFNKASKQFDQSKAESGLNYLPFHVQVRQIHSKHYWLVHLDCPVAIQSTRGGHHQFLQ